MSELRRASVAGQFYAGTKEKLIQELEESFLNNRGVGMLPKIKKGDEKLKGVVVPHAGYLYSGAIAANSYYYLSKNGFADTFVILGPNHTGMGSGVSIMIEKSWETPLGIVPINNTLARAGNSDIKFILNLLEQHSLQKMKTLKKKEEQDKE
ncbi:putative dioxygenase, partial [Thermoplasmatales archaeon SCGC AB-539-C06]